MAVALLCHQISSVEIPASGVAKGDVFYYYMYATYTASNHRAKIQVPPFETNNTEWVRVEITATNGSLISHNYTLHFKDGNEQVIVGQTNVAVNAWTTKSNFRGVPICPTNLHAGDLIPSIQLKVNETFKEPTPMGERQANRVVWNTPLENGLCIFERQTGMLLSLIRSHRFINDTTGEVVTKTDKVTLVSAVLASQRF